jgi:SAM-dependent methyltransferase
VTAAACVLCGSRSAATELETTDGRLVRCLECGLVRTASAPPAKYDGEYYSAHQLSDGLRAAGGLRERLLDRAYNTYLDRGSPLPARLLMLPVRNRLGGLPPRSLPPGDLLDVGSGDGDFIFRARAHGWRVSGQEVNAAAVSSARAAGLDVREGELAAAGFKPSSFDAVRLWHVLEHVADPVGLLGEIRPLLRPGGILIVGVPDYGSPIRRLFGARWSGLQPRYHLSHFDRRTLTSALEKAGFAVLHLRHRSVGTAYSTLAERGRAFANPVLWAALLLADDLLDLAGAGDAFELVAGVPELGSRASGGN